MVVLSCVREDTKGIYTVEALSCWVREGTKRSYSMVIFSCWVKEGRPVLLCKGRQKESIVWWPVLLGKGRHKKESIV